MSRDFIARQVFRANSSYELIRFELLPEGEQGALRGLTDDPDFWGILRSRAQGWVPARSVCRHTAALFQLLTNAGPIPGRAFPFEEQALQLSIAALVLDGVLEMAHAGRFVSGPEASELIFGTTGSGVADETEGFLPRLSRAALEYGQAMKIHDIGRLANRLYLYNGVPLTTKWARELSSPEAAAKWLGVDGAGVGPKLRAWLAVEPKMQHYPWLQWNSPMARANDHVRRGYKLYVSPNPGSLPEVFRTVVEQLDESETYAFKVGRDGANLVRADKLVVYFREFAELERLAGRLMPALSGCSVQGVPFTAALEETGLLSWGVDPLPEKGRLSGEGPESWRSWITVQLAAALVAAQTLGSGTLEPWQFALERLSLEKVDTETWAPGQGFGLAVA